MLIIKIKSTNFIYCEDNVIIQCTSLTGNNKFNNHVTFIRESSSFKSNW